MFDCAALTDQAYRDYRTDVLFYCAALADQAYRDYRTGNYSQAEKSCMALLQIEPDNTSLLLLLSSIHFQTGQLEK